MNILTCYFGIISFLFGLVLGSFLNCTSMRIVRKEDWVKGRSHCMSCGHELGALDLFPLFSYIFSGGKCRYCKSKISPRYPITELTFGLLTLGLYVASPYEPVIFIRNLILIAALFVVALVDLEIQEVPDGCIIVGCVAYFLSIPFLLLTSKGSYKLSDLIESVLSCIGVVVLFIVIAIVMEKILKRDALGGGDIKLYGMLALYLGAAGTYELILLSCVLGLIFAGVRKAVDKKADREFPFAPAIAVSGYILLIFSDTVTNWYFSLF